MTNAEWRMENGEAKAPFGLGVLRSEMFFFPFSISISLCLCGKNDEGKTNIAVLEVVRVKIEKGTVAPTEQPFLVDVSIGRRSAVIRAAGPAGSPCRNR